MNEEHYSPTGFAEQWKSNRGDLPLRGNVFLHYMHKRYLRSLNAACPHIRILFSNNSKEPDPLLMPVSKFGTSGSYINNIFQTSAVKDCFSRVGLCC